MHDNLTSQRSRINHLLLRFTYCMSQNLQKMKTSQFRHLKENVVLMFPLCLLRWVFFVVVPHSIREYSINVFLLLSVNVLSSQTNLSDLKNTQNIFQGECKHNFGYWLENSNSKHLAFEAVMGGWNKTSSIKWDVAYFIFVFMTCITKTAGFLWWYRIRNNCIWNTWKYADFIYEQY